MCTGMNLLTQMKHCEIRRQDLLQQAEKYRLVQQAMALNTDSGQHGTHLKAAMLSLVPAVTTMQRQRGATGLAEFKSAPSESPCAD